MNYIFISCDYTCTLNLAVFLLCNNHFTCTLNVVQFSFYATIISVLFNFSLIFQSNQSHRCLRTGPPPPDIDPWAYPREQITKNKRFIKKKSYPTIFEKLPKVNVLLKKIVTHCIFRYSGVRIILWNAYVRQFSESTV